MSVNQNSIGAQLTAQITAVNGAISAVPSLQESSLQIIQSIYTTAANALAPFNTAINEYDADIDTTSVGSVVSGLPATQLASALLNQQIDVEQQSRLIIGRAYLARVGVNLLNAPG